MRRLLYGAASAIAAGVVFCAALFLRPRWMDSAPTPAPGELRNADRPVPPAAAPDAPVPQAPRFPVARLAAAAVAADVAARTRLLATRPDLPEADLLAIANERRGLLRELITADPAAALSCRLTHAQRRALPEAVVDRLETPVDAFGRLEVMAVCGPQTGGTERFVQVGGVRRRAFLAGARAAAVSQERLPVHGIAVDDVLAVAAEPYRVPDAGEIAAEPSVEEGLEVLVGDERRVFAAKEDLDDWADRTRAAETVLPSVFGDRKILFVMVDFSDAPGAPTTAAEILKSMDAVNAYYREMSANRLSFTTTVLPAVLRAPQTKAAYSADSRSDDRIMTDALNALRDYETQNGNRGFYAQSSFQHIALIFAKISSYDFAGQATRPGYKIWLNGSASDGTIAHELGHNLGLAHAYAWKPATSVPIGNGTHVEYGDPFDRMGTNGALKNAFFGTPKKRALGFITDANLVSVRTSGEYRIFRHDGEIGSRVVGLKIDAGAAYDYWIEYRKQVPEGLADYTDAMAAGVQLRWNKLPNFTQAGATGTYLLDMTPGSAGDMKDSTLTLGNSFVDPAYGIRITPLRTGTSSEGDWIEVAVVLGDRPGNRAPTVQSAAAAETAFARVPVNLTARASDADGDTVLYQWDFGDGRPVYSTEASVQKQWVAGGTYSVSVRAFDIYGGESRQTFQVSISDPLGSWTKVTVPGMAENLNAVCYGSGRFVAVGVFATASSLDGKSWSRGTTGTSGMYADSVAFGAGRFVAVGRAFNYTSRAYDTGLFYSLDGSSWSQFSTVRSEWLNSVAYGGGRFVAVGDSGMIWSSADGQMWLATQLVSKMNLRSVSYNGSEFLAVGEGQTAIYSKSGETWQDVSPSKENTESATYSVLEGTAGTSVIYFNGGWHVITNWRYTDLSAGISWRSLSFGRWQGVERTYMPLTYWPRLMLIGDGSSLMTFTWSSTANNSASIATSLDGVSWKVTAVGGVGSTALRGGAEGNGRIVVVGNDAQI